MAKDICDRNGFCPVGEPELFNLDAYEAVSDMAREMVSPPSKPVRVCLGGLSAGTRVQKKPVAAGKRRRRAVGR